MKLIVVLLIVLAENAFSWSDRCNGRIDATGTNCTFDADHCGNYIIRYAYNSTSGNCVSFVWGGDKSTPSTNSNNFKTRDQCRRVCMNQTHV